MKNIDVIIFNNLLTIDEKMDNIFKNIGSVSQRKNFSKMIVKAQKKLKEIEYAQARKKHILKMVEKEMKKIVYPPIDKMTKKEFDSYTNRKQDILKKYGYHNIDVDWYGLGKIFKEGFSGIPRYISLINMIDDDVVSLIAINKIAKSLIKKFKIKTKVKFMIESRDEEYEKFFLSALEKFGVKEPDELSTDKKKEFFNYIDKNWKGKGEMDEAFKNEIELVEKEYKKCPECKETKMYPVYNAEGDAIEEYKCESCGNINKDINEAMTQKKLQNMIVKNHDKYKEFDINTLSVSASPKESRVIFGYKDKKTHDSAVKNLESLLKEYYPNVEVNIAKNRGEVWFILKDDMNEVNHVGVAITSIHEGDVSSFIDNIHDALFEKLQDNEYFITINEELNLFLRDENIDEVVSVNKSDAIDFLKFIENGLEADSFEIEPINKNLISVKYNNTDFGDVKFLFKKDYNNVYLIGFKNKKIKDNKYKGIPDSFTNINNVIDEFDYLIKYDSDLYTPEELAKKCKTSIELSGGDLEQDYFPDS